MTQKTELESDLFERMVEEVEDYAILILDTNGIILNWNKGAERIKGYKAQDIIGKSFYSFYTQSDRDAKKPDSLLKRARIDNKAQDEGWRVRADGTTFWGSITITAIHNNAGEIIGFSKVTKDLTEARKTEEARELYTQRLEAMNKELRQFAYIASHDLQEPLRTIQSFTQLLSTDYSHHFDDFGHRGMNFILEATERMSQLIKGLLDYNRLGRNPEKTLVDCNKLVSEVMDDLSLLIQESNASITVGELPQLDAYETELRLLFQNLLGNAIKFRRPQTSPNISLTASREKDFWTFSIKDDGIGIETKNNEKIFLIYQRLNHREDYEGTGIGLAHCQKIVDLHGGKIWVESELDQGSIFHFTIPIQD